MPQLIAMVIVVVGAMIYMFQTFGGTGDKIEGVAQKASIITEINNIKDGIKIAAKSGHIGDGANSDDGDDAVTSLKGLAELSYFAEQINDQVINNTMTGDDDNTYNAISFGGTQSENGGMHLKLVASTATSTDGAIKMIPGIYVDLGFAAGNLSSNAAFLEAQVANDLDAIANIDRHATSATSATSALNSTGTSLEKRTPGVTTTADSSITLKDGKFIIYFKDFGSDEVVK